MYTPNYIVFRISGQKFAVKYDSVIDITYATKPKMLIHAKKSQEHSTFFNEDSDNQDIDLRAYLGIKPDYQVSQKLITVCSVFEGAKKNYRILVDEVFGLMNMDNIMFHPYRTLISKNINDVREAIAIVQNEPIVIINANKIPYIFEPVDHFNLTLAMLN